MKALLLDMGGVVIEINPRAVFEHWAEAANVGIAELDSRWLLDEAYKAHEVGAIDFSAYIRTLSQRLNIELSESAWLAGWNALFVGPYAGVASALSAAAAHLPTFCYTNTNPAHQAEWSRRYQSVLSPFEKIYVSSEIGRRKPDPESFQWVAEDMGFEPSDIMFLDDSRENIRGAERAGMQTLEVTGPDVAETLLRRLARPNPSSG